MLDIIGSHFLFSDTSIFSSMSQAEGYILSKNNLHLNGPEWQFYWFDYSWPTNGSRPDSWYVLEYYFCNDVLSYWKPMSYVVAIYAKIEVLNVNLN